MKTAILACVVALVAACGDEQPEQATFSHQGEYRLTWARTQTTCIDAPAMPDLVYVGQYPANYPGGVGGMAAASFYYRAGAPQAMSGEYSTTFDADDMDLEPLDVKVRLGEVEHLEPFTLHFVGDSLSADVHATRASGCTTTFRLSGTK